MQEEGIQLLLGTVINVNTKTLMCDIMRPNGSMLYDVAIANTTGGFYTNDVNWGSNIRNSAVYYAYIDGTPYVLGTLPTRTVPENKISVPVSETKTGGDNRTTYGAGTKASYAAGANMDYQPNDKVISTDGGAHLALLSEGGAILKVSPLCQLILGAGMDFARLVCRQFQIFTDFGSLEFSHGSSGRNGLTIKGGAMYGGESMADAGTHTVFMHLGDTDENPDARFGVRVTDTDGNMFCGLVMQKNGKMVFTSSHDYLISVGRNYDCRVDGNYTQEICGSRREEIHGCEARRVYKDRTTVIVGNENKQVGENQTHIIGKDSQTNITNDSRLTIGGQATTNVEKDKVVSVNGSLVLSANNIVVASKGSSSGAPVKFTCSSFDIIKG